MYLKISNTEKNDVVRKKIGYVWKLYLDNFGSCRRGLFTTPLIQNLFLKRIYDISESVRNEFFWCVCSLDAFDSLMALSKPCDDSKDLNVAFKELIMSSNNTESFQTNYVCQILAYLGLGPFLPLDEQYFIEKTKPGINLSDWLPNIYRMSKTSEHLLKSNSYKIQYILSCG